MSCSNATQLKSTVYKRERLKTIQTNNQPFFAQCDAKCILSPCEMLTCESPKSFHASPPFLEFLQYCTLKFQNGQQQLPPDIAMNTDNNISSKHTRRHARARPTHTLSIHTNSYSYYTLPGVFDLRNIMINCMPTFLHSRSLGAFPT